MRVGRSCRNRKNFPASCNVVDVDVQEWLTGLPEPFFFCAKAALAPAPQVYKQKLVYRIVVVVNGAAHLWISQVFSTTSNVYVCRNPVGYRCVCLREKMNKNRGCTKTVRSPQSVPVDMQMLIHRPPACPLEPVLWDAVWTSRKRRPWNPPVNTTTSSWERARSVAYSRIARAGVPISTSC